MGKFMRGKFKTQGPGTPLDGPVPPAMSTDRSCDAETQIALRHTLEALKLTAPLADWAPLAGGRSNLIWRVGEKDRVLVAKLFRTDKTNPLFPNDPSAEALVLDWLDGTQIAPRIRARANTALGICILYDLAEGRAWSADSAPVARLLSQLHKFSPPHPLRSTPDGSAALAADAERIIDLCAPGDMRDVLLGARPETDPVAPQNAQCLLHGDPVPGNIIVTDKGPVLIDWQCPATGDPTEDIALFLSPAMQILYRGSALDNDERDAFLTAYGNPAVTRRYRLLAPWYHWRMAAYCLWRGAENDPQEARAFKAELDALAR